MRIGFLIFPGFPMSCLTSLIEPLRAANEISSKAAFDWILLAETDERVDSSAGVAFDSNVALKDAKGLDFLILLAAPSSRFQDDRTPGHLRRLARHGTILGAISGGVFPLARSAAGGAARLSVHWCYEAAFAAEFPDVERSDHVVEIASNCVTASGAAAAFDLALHFIREALGETVSTEVACWFQHPIARQLGARQVIPSFGSDSAPPDLPEKVSRAIEIFGQTLSEPISVADVAARLDITPRHLERSFKQATGFNPSGYFRQMRMKAARQIVMYSNDKIADIAAAVGYGSTKPFVQHYRAAFGLSPLEDRRKINMHRVQGNRPVPSV